MNHERHEKHEKILFKEECYEIQGAIFEVYREMGCGFLESVYQECLEKELRKRRIPFVAQQELQLTYKGEPLQQTYRPDLICYGQIIVELKAVKDIAPEHKAQVINSNRYETRFARKLWNISESNNHTTGSIAFRVFRAFRG